ALHVESDELLSQHTRYLLVATRGLRSVDGQPVAASPAFRAFVDGAPAPGEPAEVTVYRGWLRLGLTVAGAVGGGRQGEVVAASVFTTQSATAVLEKIRDQIHAATPAPADFLLGPNRERTVFNLDDLTGITFHEQTRTDPALPTTDVSVPLGELRIIPG